MAVTQVYLLDAVTISTTEISIVSGTSTLQAITTAGAYQLFIDGANVGKSDEFEVKLYETVKAGGTKRVVATWPIFGVQVSLFVTPTMMLMNGWDMTLKKLAGTDRAFTASIRKAG